MKFFKVFILFSFLGSAMFGQPYYWVLKQSGSSLGGPSDYYKNNTDIIYYGTGSVIYKSTDRGESFSITGTNIPGSSEIKSIILNDDLPGVLLVAIEAAPNDKIYKSTNDGVNWVLSLDEGQFSYFGIPMTQDPSIPATIFTMAGQNFKKSTDFGSTWTTITSNTGSDSAPCDIEVFPNSSTILIGDNGTGIFRSTDYGLTWAQTYFTSGEIPTIAVDFQNPGVAWATKWGGSGGFLKSTDYGATWTPQPGFTGQNMWGVHVQRTEGNNVLTGCYGCGTVWRTKNGGLTWMTISTPSSNYQVMTIDSMTQFTVQGNGIYKLESPWFIPVELSSFTASVTGNEINLNWTTATELNNYGFEIEQSYDNNNFEKIGFVPGFGTTTETKSYSFTVEQPMAGIQYYRLKQVDFDGTSEHSNSVEVDGPVPADFVLNQNYPNPFNPSTSISFSLPVESSVKIRLFSMLGEEVAEIVNENFQAGSHKVDFLANGLSSGAYIYVIDAAGVNGNNFVSNKKMILLR
ncbi:MAG TPA: T9SS type A sorting domain-containing protein [Ignavibacteriaceae bacterium]|nr:T9SS type A sorting domain-containing protein [Ignavibacteriaceae bacterium]